MAIYEYEFPSGATVRDPWTGETVDVEATIRHTGSMSGVRLDMNQMSYKRRRMRLRTTTKTGELSAKLADTLLKEFKVQPRAHA